MAISVTLVGSKDRVLEDRLRAAGMRPTSAEVGELAALAHPSALPAAELKALEPARLRDIDLVITSYGSLLRLPWIAGP